MIETCRLNVATRQLPLCHFGSKANAVKSRKWALPLGKRRRPVTAIGYFNIIKHRNTPLNEVRCWVRELNGTSALR